MRVANAPPRFALWREVLFAYLAPALSAEAGGLITRQPELMLAAPTSIAGTSAVVAFALGLWLRHRGSRIAWLPTAAPAALAAGFGLSTTALAAIAAQLLTRTPWFGERIRLDVPLATAVASTIVVWRWASIRRKEVQ
ncbi:hypothetical protein [Nocardia concava]|uniref:hypothetical protein n=1 Tax=Nocardia concava TaxID=257281 RepID=UPI0002DB388F|nr:hypothetical protein [Nocardia concava]